MIRPKHKKWIAWGLIIAGVAYAFTGDFVSDLVINVPTAQFIAQYLGVPFEMALLATFTVVPIALIGAGVLIYPAQNNYVLHKIKGKLLGKKKKRRKK